MKSLLLMFAAFSTFVSGLNNTVIPFYPGCYSEDTITHSLDIGIAVDYGTSKQIIDSGSSIQNAIEDVISVAKIVYKKQFNIVIKVSKIVVGNEKSPLPLSRSNYLGTCTNAVGAFDEMNAWNQNQYNNSAYWMLFSNCFSGITGISYVGSICGSSNVGVSSFDWLDFAHELGHGIGGSHTFGFGGIMDYGTGKYNDVVQFYPGQRDEICSFLNYVSTRCLRYFKKMSKDEECGDGILSGSETCECLNGSKNCGTGTVLCTNCQTSSVCSSSEFIVRNPYQDSIVSVSFKELSDKNCCVNGVQSGPKTLCSNSIDVCSNYGRCTKACSKAFGLGTKICEFDSDGCKQGCIFNNRCRYDITVINDFVSIVEDGTPCINNGVCLSGMCISNNGSITTEPTVQPTTLPTALPTALPTTLPVQCNKLKNKTNCISKNCKWNSGKCMSKPVCSSLKNRKGCISNKCRWYLNKCEQFKQTNNTQIKN